jgi:uncharacterized protein YodC (DUF2158 family)
MPDTIPENFASGDIVYLKSGSPALTLDRVIGDGAAKVIWSDAGRLMRQYLSLAALTKAAPPPPSHSPPPSPSPPASGG